MLNAPIDVSVDFRDFTDTYFVAERVAEFDLAKGQGLDGLETLGLRVGHVVQ